MRGTTTLILHSLDPESLDKVEDLDSLDPESDEDDPFCKDIYGTETGEEISTKYQIPFKSNRSSARNVGHHAETNKFFDLMELQLSSSPPLTKSYYGDEAEDQNLSNSPSNPNEVMNRLFHSNGDECNSLRAEKAGSRLPLPLSRVRSCRNQTLINSDEISLDVDVARNSGGLTKFLNSIGLRSNKGDKNRFDVHKLPPQLRAELKNIYVY